MNVNCVICREDSEWEQDLSALPCGHLFHCACLRKWLLNSKTCPQCRKPYGVQNMLKLKLRNHTFKSFNNSKGGLLNKIKELENDVKQKDQDIDEARRVKLTLTTKCSKLEAEEEERHQKMMKYKFQNQGFIDRIRDLKNEYDKYDTNKKQMDELQCKLIAFKDTDYILTRNQSKSESFAKNIKQKTNERNYRENLKKLGNRICNMKYELCAPCNECLLSRNKFEEINQRYLKCKEDLDLLRKKVKESNKSLNSEVGKNLAVSEQSNMKTSTSKSEDISDVNDAISVDYEIGIKKISTVILD